jgi:hypothetical protein
VSSDIPLKDALRSPVVLGNWTLSNPTEFRSVLSLSSEPKRNKQQDNQPRLERLDQMEAWKEVPEEKIANKNESRVTSLGPENGRICRSEAI